MQFKIEQIAIHPRNAEKAIALLSDMGLSEWARDHVCAEGQVFGTAAGSEADLAFNYDAAAGGLEFEVLDYTAGKYWMSRHGNSTSHLGMHVSAEELVSWREFFSVRGINVAQEVNTFSHTNPVIAGKRVYNYVIFDTRDILGVDIKFIVRKDISAS